jgi:hypothetical protein
MYILGWEMGQRLKKEMTYVYLWLIHVNVWQKPTEHCKASILQLKINKFLKRLVCIESEHTVPLDLVTILMGWSVDEKGAFFLSTPILLPSPPFFPRTLTILLAGS